MFTTITHSEDIAQAQRAFESRVHTSSVRSGMLAVGYQGGGREVMTHFLDRLKIWIAFDDADNRYWNALGLGDPFKGSKAIIAEINPPRAGLNSRVSGAFVRDAEGKVFVVHRGRVGGGRKGIGKEAFLAWYDGALALTKDGSQHNSVIVIGALDDPALLDNLALFINKVATFKDFIVAKTNRPGVAGQSHSRQPSRALPRTPAIQEVSDYTRSHHLTRFYETLDELECRIGGRRTLGKCSGYMDWPTRGVYFFMEDGETRSDTGNGLRVVRVGTHALKAGANTTLWTRLSQHQGVTKSGGGNHRGSIFRLIVGTALSAKPEHDFPSWGKGSTASREVRDGELPLEKEVSQVIGRMPFVWIPIEDEAGPYSDRSYIERNSISLLSNFNKSPLDAASAKWLGHFCDRERVQHSGLWNSNHVDEPYEPAFLDRLEQLVSAIRPAP
jgi:hypothetical protein